MKYRIDHYQVKDVYYPKVKTFWGWRYIQPHHTRTCELSSLKYATYQSTMQLAEMVIKEYHEQVTKSTVVSLDVKINDGLLKKRMEKAKKFNEKIK